MEYWDDFQELYNTEDEWYFDYVDRELKRIKRRQNNDNYRSKTP